MPQQHVRVVRPADREHLPVREPDGDVAHTQTPLVRALEIAYPLACIKREATHRLDRVRIGHLAANGGCSGGVDAPHALRDLADADEREPVEPQREHLDVDRSYLTGERDRARRLCARRDRVVVEQECEMSAQHRYTRRGNARRLPLDEHRGALDPARRLSRPAKRVRVITQLDRELRRRRDVATRAREPVAPLVSLDRGLRVELVARGDTEALIRLRSLVLRQRLGEPRPRFGPPAARERCTTLRNRFAALIRPHSHNIVPTPTPTQVAAYRSSRPAAFAWTQRRRSVPRT